MAGENVDNGAQEKIDVIKQQHGEATERQFHQGDLLDKAILAASSATLGFSLTFLKRFKIEPECHCLLVGGWLLLALSVIAVILGMRFTQSHCVAYRDYLDKLYWHTKAPETYHAPSEFKYRLYGVVFTALIWTSVIAFALGLLSIVAFCGVNWRGIIHA